MSRPYGYRWQVYSKAFLARNRWCALHRKLGQAVPATVVHHITPHRGDSVLFWDKTNHQALCKPCHDGPMQAQEKGGVQRLGCDVNGNPLDPEHHWNRKRNA